MGVKRRDLIKFMIILVPFFGLMIAWLGFGERGFIHLHKMERERRVYVEKIQTLEKENQRLLDEIHRLKTDPSYVESVARKELGLVKDNEIIYRFDRRQGDTSQKEKKSE